MATTVIIGVAVLRDGHWSAWLNTAKGPQFAGAYATRHIARRALLLKAKMLNEEAKRKAVSFLLRENRRVTVAVQRTIPLA